MRRPLLLLGRSARAERDLDRVWDELHTPQDPARRAILLRQVAGLLDDLAAEQTQGPEGYLRGAELIRLLADLEGVAGTGVYPGVVLRDAGNRWLPAGALRVRVWHALPADLIGSLGRELRQYHRGVLIAEMHRPVERVAGVTAAEIVYAVGAAYVASDRARHDSWFWWRAEAR